MIVALDFDGTVTADPVFWTGFVSDLLDREHRVVTVTHRRDTFENRRAIENVLGPSHPIVFAYDKPKKLAAIEAGYAVDIWIDDNPHGIGDGTENVATQSVFEIELRNALEQLRRFDGMERSHKSVALIARIETVLKGPAT